MFQVHGLSKTYGKPPLVALDAVDLTIPTGSLFGLLGPNGAGKTTLLSILVGLVGKTAGEVHFDGQAVAGRLAAMRRQIGFVPQDFAFYPSLSGRENLRFFAAAAGVPRAQRNTRIDACAQITGLNEHLDKPAARYSGGMKRRLNLAIGLLHQPRVLCLDEPTVGIDAHSRRFILDRIVELNRQGITVIYTSHYLEEVEQICDHLAVIDGGRIVLQGPMQQLLQRMHSGKLQVRFAAAPPASSLAQLQQQGFVATDAGGRNLALHTPDAPAALAALGSIAGLAGLHIERCHYGAGNLEEAYLQLLRGNASTVEHE